MLTRFPGCKISECDLKDFDALDLHIGKVKDGQPQRNALEGKRETLTYICPAKHSAIELSRNAENAMKKVGYKIIFSGKEENDFPIVTGQKGGQWLQVRGRPHDADSAYDVSALLVKEMTQQLEATADAWAAGLASGAR